MHVRKHTDQGFDDFVRERKRVRAKLGPQQSVLGYENQALRELEQVEAREVRDQQLTREVHDFFAAATQKAAAIVERVAHEAQAQAGQQLEVEVERFLIDALSRMNTFVVNLMQQRRYANVAETQIEPHVGHIVGPGLDEFRWEGTAAIPDKHIGQDPFATTVEEVQREFRAAVGAMQGVAEPVASIEDHLVAETETEDVPSDASVPAPADGAEAEPGDADGAAAAAATDRPAAAEPTVQPDGADAEHEPSPDQELAAYKNALKALVRQGVMRREEARAAWLTRLAALGRSPE